MVTLRTCFCNLALSLRNFSLARQMVLAAEAQMGCIAYDPESLSKKKPFRERVIRHVFLCLFMFFWRLGCFHPSKLRAQGLAPFSLV